MYCIQCTQVDCIYFIFLCFVWIELVLQFKYFYLFPEHSTGKTIVWCSSKFVPNKRKREIVETLKSSAYFSTTTITHKNPKPILITYMQTHFKLIERQLFPLKVQCERPAEEYFRVRNCEFSPKCTPASTLKWKLPTQRNFSHTLTAYSQLSEKKENSNQLERFRSSADASAATFWLRNNCFHYYCYQI